MHCAKEDIWRCSQKAFYDPLERAQGARHEATPAIQTDFRQKLSCRASATERIHQPPHSCLQWEVNEKIAPSDNVNTLGGEWDDSFI